MAKFFNMAGPVNPRNHYCAPPLDRLRIAEIQGLIGQEKYFVLYAPRQTGKTSRLLALATDRGRTPEQRFRAFLELSCAEPDKGTARDLAPFLDEETILGDGLSAAFLAAEVIVQVLDGGDEARHETPAARQRLIQRAREALERLRSGIEAPVDRSDEEWEVDLGPYAE